MLDEGSAVELTGCKNCGGTHVGVLGPVEYDGNGKSGFALRPGPSCNPDALARITEVTVNEGRVNAL